MICIINEFLPNIRYNESGDNMKEPKIVFMGTPNFAVPVLEKLIANYNVVLVVTQPDKRVGRKQILTPTPIKEIALKNNIPVFQPEKIRKDFDLIKEIHPDLIITCAYGQIIPSEVLNIPSIGCFNVHASLLPKYRGGAPIHKCLINGEKETGVTIMYMDVGMDTGDMIEKTIYQIQKDDNVGTLHEKLSVLGADLLLKTLPSIMGGTNQRTKQNESEATYAYNVKREEERLDFNKSGEEIINQIRGLNPWPTANCMIKKEEMKILEAYFVEKKETFPGIICEVTKETFGVSCKNGIVYITKIKPFGKKIILVKDYLNGLKQDDLLNEKVE